MILGKAASKPASGSKPIICSSLRTDALPRPPENGLAVTMISVAAEEIAHGGPASSAIAQRTAMAAHAYGRTGRMA